jgi:hypothetical protein
MVAVILWNRIQKQVLVFLFRVILIQQFSMLKININHSTASLAITKTNLFRFKNFQINLVDQGLQQVPLQNIPSLKCTLTLLLISCVTILVSSAELPR